MAYLTRQQKIAAILLSVIAIAAVAIELYALPQQMKKPFVPKTNQVFKTLDQQEQERIQLLKNTDTDGDGLSDYDEMYIYHTSAYNDDSDSDGIPDGVEVRSGGDPTCPSGKTCRAVAAPAPAAPAPVPASPPAQGTGTAVPSSADAAVYRAFTKAFGDISKMSDADIAQKVDQMSSADLRSFLESIGMPPQAIAKNDDATLRRLLKDTIGELSAGN